MMREKKVSLDAPSFEYRCSNIHYGDAFTSVFVSISVFHSVR